MNASDAGRQRLSRWTGKNKVDEQQPVLVIKDSWTFCGLIEEYKRKEKKREVNKRIAQSAEIGASRRQKMIAWDELLKTLIVKVQSQLKNYTILDDKNKVLLRDLIVQRLIKLFETDVVVAVRAKDVQLAEMVVTEATDKYIATMKKEANLDVSKVKGKIVCDNTLETRLDQICYDLKPTVRKMLFSAL
ncbi:unnamed protein product [Peronospora destructor]|uniref:V-type proton ATPase subunit E n=1 Tax=Peronospora destructor TaxID=86335 RepID=A0AAV0UPT9_9STRA|nr:unnamed protein product [Peronospora destructor]